MNSISLGWDKYYGIDRRKGWTLTCNGRVIVELSPLWKAVIVGAYLILRDWEYLYEEPQR